MRRWLLRLAVLLVVLAGGLAAFLFLPEPQEEAVASRNQPTGQALIERGRYLARAADCVACHTRPGGAEYAGGLAFDLPFGTIYAPNITPDRETGIGDWSDAEFVRAMHRGVGKDGQMLYPAFPYASYALMSTDDVLAIKAYLASLPAVRAEAPASTLRFPFDQRYLMRLWRVLFVPGHRFQPDEQKPPEWNRGAYLVEALGHCGECHTPRNALYGLDSGRKFAGAMIQGWKAYNITSDRPAGIGDWSDEELVSYLSTGFAPGRGTATGNMADAVEHSLRHLTAPDIRAMVSYLRTVPPQATGAAMVAERQPPAVRASTAYRPPAEESTTWTLGLEVFQGACASCHGWNGEGLQHAQAGLVGADSVNDPEGTNLLQVVLHGARLTTPEGVAFMPAFGQAYSDAEIAAVSNYVLAHYGAKRAAITPADVAAARRMQ